ncbi:MAG: RDD family protein, partial [Balneolaceae bacterium]|nr:RDD family protein [Balneolaceae bacterium]
SAHQATWGKRWQGIRVIQNNGEKLTKLRSLGRTALKFIPWELAHTCIWQINYGSREYENLIMIGFILVWVWVGIYLLTLLINPKNQALYDKIAKTWVVQS